MKGVEKQYWVLNHLFSFRRKYSILIILSFRFLSPVNYSCMMHEIRYESWNASKIGSDPKGPRGLCFKYTFSKYFLFEGPFSPLTHFFVLCLSLLWLVYILESVLARFRWQWTRTSPVTSHLMGSQYGSSSFLRPEKNERTVVNLLVRVEPPYV